MEYRLTQIQSPSRYQPAWAEAAMRSAPNFTVQACLAENARIRPLIPQRHLLWLKGKALTMTNQSLRSQPDALSNDTLMAVVTLAFQDLIFEDGRAAKFHMNGLLQMVRLRGGFGTLSIPLRKLIVEADSLQSFLKSQPRLFPIDNLPLGWAFDPNHPFRLVAFDSGWCHDVSNPLRLAFQPRNSDLSPQRLRNHLVVSFLGTAQGLVLIFSAIQHIAGLSLTWPYALAPMQAKAHASEIEMYILLNWSPLKPHLRLDTSIFSDEDREYHDLLADCGRLCALVLLARLLQLLEQSALAAAKVDHNAMALGMVDASPILKRDPKVGCWILMVGTAFLSGVLQKSNALGKIAEICENLQVRSWEALLELLESIFFCSTLQEEQCRQLWPEIEGRMQEKTLADRSGVTDAVAKNDP